MFNLTCVYAFVVGSCRRKTCRWLGPQGWMGRMVSHRGSVGEGDEEEEVRKRPSTETSGAWLPEKKAVSISKPWTRPEETPSWTMTQSSGSGLCRRVSHLS